MSELILIGAAALAALSGAVLLCARRLTPSPTWVCRICRVDFSSERDGILHCQLVHPREFSEQHQWSAGPL